MLTGSQREPPTVYSGLTRSPSNSDRKGRIGQPAHLIDAQALPPIEEVAPDITQRTTGARCERQAGSRLFAPDWPGRSERAYTGTAMPVSVLHPETPESAARLPAAIDEQLDLQLFKALADPTRLLVLACLIKCGRRCSVSEVAECCSVDFSVVNKHMKVLAAAGVLSAEKEGRTVWYAARCSDLCERFARLIDAIAEWCPNLDQPGHKGVAGSCCSASDGGGH